MIGLGPWRKRISRGVGCRQPQERSKEKERGSDRERDVSLSGVHGVRPSWGTRKIQAPVTDTRGPRSNNRCSKERRNSRARTLGISPIANPPANHEWLVGRAQVTDSSRPNQIFNSNAEIQKSSRIQALQQATDKLRGIFKGAWTFQSFPLIIPLWS